ncbi:uncharacterized protein LOC104897327 [Beta vulgaris subsp. vulgaris]|uniref:uncharacterized protein LOC104897327 n=1 Tax=Beta vulgaris subsp. vulgaris TaxID=3555 RepID=UPI00203742B4|nr:uncharacterized protein LOC104897327 [Beta vulgaris subsp. vulgaris]
MMNLIAISLITTSLVVSGLFSPNPEKNGGKQEQVIIKEGHRSVVVEYGDDISDGNTKVLISSPQPNKGPIDETLSHATASVAGKAQDMKEKAQDVVTGLNGPHGARPRELICDAYGKCKHKIAGVWSKAKEKAAEAEEVVEEVVEKTMDIASIAGRKAEETGEVIKEKGEKGEKELFDIVKRGKEVLFDVIWYVFGIWREILSLIMSVSELIGMSIAYGVGIWVTFVMSHVLAGVLPKQQFGIVQSKIYPVYFKVMIGSIGLSLVGYMMGEKGKMLNNKTHMVQFYNLLSSLLLVLGNLLFLEPRATKAMFDRMKLEKEEGRGRDRVSAPTRVIDTVVDDSTGPIPTTTTTTTTTAAGGTTTAPASTAPARTPEDDAAKTKLAKLDNRLKKLNSYSSLLNIMTLMGLTWHLVYLSQRLRATNS